MKAVSAFAGIGGFDEGFRQVGIETLCQIEWDKDCQTVLGRHFPGTKLMGDICDVSGGVRTLTLTEWERLQMFPDGWTEGISNSARHTALGNAMHVGMAAWLGRRLIGANARVPA